MSKLAENIKTLIVLQGLDTALEFIDTTVEELGSYGEIGDLENAVQDEVSYAIEDAE